MTLEADCGNQTDPVFLAFGSAVINTLTTSCPTILTALSDVGICLVDKDKPLRVFAVDVV